MIPKSQWGNGPWQQEPDQLRWVDKATGYTCVILRAMEIGHLCGYVGVMPNHPAHGLHYNGCTTEEAEASNAAFRAAMRKWDRTELSTLDGLPPRPEVVEGIGNGIADITVHGGLTYSGGNLLGQESDTWWFGFDCAHAGDLCPGMQATLREIGHIKEVYPGYEDIYRTVDYVRAECVSLALQLKQLMVVVPEEVYHDGEQR